MRRHQKYWLWCLGAPLLWLSGCGDLAPFVPAPRELPQPPQISRFAVQPAELSYLGGMVQIEAEVEDENNDLEQVIAEITPPEGTTPVTVQLLGGTGDTLLRGAHPFPGNRSEEGQAQIYQIQVKARDRL